MTFLLGFHCFDGLLLCADSEENDTISKKYIDKLHIQPIHGEPGICFGSSGDASIGDKLRSKLFDVLKDMLSEPAKVELVAEKVLEHCIKKYGNNISILLAQADQTELTTHLYRTYQDHVLRPIDGGSFTCVGMDTSLAQFILESVFDSLMGIEECLRLGVWVTALMKLTTADVSGPTIAFSYKKGDSHWKRRYAVEINPIEEKYPPAEIWQMLRNYWENKNGDIYKVLENGTRMRWADTKQSASGKSESEQ